MLTTTEFEYPHHLQSRDSERPRKRRSPGAMATVWSYTQSLCQGEHKVFGNFGLELMYFKRRTTKHTPAAAKSAPKPTVKPTAAAKEANKEAPAPAAQKESPLEDTKSNRATPQPGPAATLKRADSKSKLKKDASAGDLFKSFAKAKPKAKEPEKPKEDDGIFPNLEIRN